MLQANESYLCCSMIQFDSDFRPRVWDSIPSRKCMWSYHTMHATWISCYSLFLSTSCSLHNRSYFCVTPIFWLNLFLSLVMNISFTILVFFLVFFCYFILSLKTWTILDLLSLLNFTTFSLISSTNSLDFVMFSFGLAPAASYAW